MSTVPHREADRLCEHVSSCFNTTECFQRVTLASVPAVSAVVDGEWGRRVPGALGAPVSEYLGSMVETMTLGWGLLRQANLEHKQLQHRTQYPLQSFANLAALQQPSPPLSPFTQPTSPSEQEEARQSLKRPAPSGFYHDDDYSRRPSAPSPTEAVAALYQQYALAPSALSAFDMAQQARGARQPYNCGRCGQLKKGHVCPIKKVRVREVTVADACTQTDFDDEPGESRARTVSS